MDEMEDLLLKIETNDEIHTFVLTGTGRKTFISGGDLREFHTLKTAEEARAMAKRMHSILAQIEKLPCWTIASVNGAVYGGGWEIMLAFDFSIADPTADFGFTQSKFYLPPGWGGLTRLVERVGRSTALRWLGEAAVVGTEQALSHGLIDRICEAGQLETETRTWAQKLDQPNRGFIKNLKQGALHFTKNRWKAMEAELDSFEQHWESEEHLNRVAAFLRGKLNLLTLFTSTFKMLG